ncbi:DUF4873 domain-containing protein [Mycobacterium xenopi]|uniref:DUF4873 domain-containing protein n=1 Tax=Mycobacterium xenopi TaxID=1789 RepID=A0AAD1GZ98_MYCXE|nr:DUF4873 domain-containing protein [Mycobacterium xenopi]MDA3640608.1 DUF4873 domain-containing protein [Mycobacterium xenopi]MDA3657317.1 DUF4873 domain-containing protein [Mycobacterium xenopi]BBU21450.1 hypothetical protein MYXE_12390 [Mycobacterium xenopi]SPX78661.1 lipolytic enzyme [Mycobacterium xenopi]
MTKTAATAEPRHDVVVAGGGAEAACARTALTEAGLTCFVLQDRVLTAVFDDDTDTWTLTTSGGQTCRGRVAIATDSRLFVPWIPKLQGQHDFRGMWFHSATPSRDFDPAGKRVAVIGADSTGGREIERLVASAASVAVFAYSPRRFVPMLPGPATRTKRWVRRHAWPVQQAAPKRRPELVGAPIDAVTPNGIRTCDGEHHDVDAIIYGTGFRIADHVRDDSLVGTRGITLRQAWHDGMEPYLGVAVHGFPNYFLITGPDYQAQERHIIDCLRLMARRDSARIEVRRSSQQVFNERVYLRCPGWPPVASAFDLSSSIDLNDHAYDGPATLRIADTDRPVRVRLTGYVDPIDGQFHWQGTLFDNLPTDLLQRTRTVTLAVGERSAPARIVEETPQHTHTIVGVGMPPFASAPR